MFGVIFRFHGTGGSASAMFNKDEDFTFARDAVAAGYAIAALDSTDRVNKQWDATVTSNNVDVLNVQASINYLTGLGLMAGAEMLGRDTELLWENGYGPRADARAQADVVLLWLVVGVSLLADNALAGFVAVLLARSICLRVRRSPGLRRLTR